MRKAVGIVRFARTDDERIGRSLEQRRGRRALGGQERGPAGDDRDPARHRGAQQIEQQREIPGRRLERDAQHLALAAARAQRGVERPRAGRETARALSRDAFERHDRHRHVAAGRRIAAQHRDRAARDLQPEFAIGLGRGLAGDRAGKALAQAQHAGGGGVHARCRQLARFDRSDDPVERGPRGAGPGARADAIGAGGQRGCRGRPGPRRSGDRLHLERVGEHDPGEAQFAAQQGIEQRRRERRRALRVERRHAHVRGHDGRHPGRDRGAERHSSRARRVAPSTSSEGKATCESRAVAPCPGKCLAVDAIPPAAKPRTSAAPSSATRCGSLPSARAPIAVFSGASARSSTGARSTLKPKRTTSRASRAPARNANAASPVAPSAIIDGISPRSPRSRATRPPS